MLRYVLLPFLVAFFALTLATPESASASASESIGCESDIFVPTSEFQPVCEGQAIPPGLHIRLNLQTGAREARLPGPPPPGGEAHEASDAVLVLEEDSETTVQVGLEHGGDGDCGGEGRSMLEKSGQRPPAYSNVGRIRPPTDGSEVETYESSVAVVLFPASGDSEESTLQALEHLEELSHDIYYGVEVAKNTRLVRALLELVGGTGSEIVRATAPLILGNAVQNSPSALEQIRSSDVDLTEEVLALLEQERVAKVEERLMFALDKLVRTRSSLKEFVELRGLDRLRKVFAVENTGIDQRDGVRRRCAAFITDHFLDEDMIGANVNDERLGPKGDARDQHVMSSDSAELDLKEWCNAFRSGLEFLGDRDAESGLTRETMEAALRFPKCASTTHR